MEKLLAFLIMAACSIVIAGAQLWLVGSLVTSSVKGLSHSCDQTYSIESLVSGNWFCPSK